MIMFTHPRTNSPMLRVIPESIYFIIADCRIYRYTPTTTAIRNTLGQPDTQISYFMKNHKTKKSRFWILDRFRMIFWRFEKILFFVLKISFFVEILKNQSEVMLLTETDLGNVIFMKKPSRLIPEKPIFDPRWPILSIFISFFCNFQARFEYLDFLLPCFLLPW